MAQTEQKNQNVKKQFEELQSLLERAMALQTSMVLFEWDDETLAPKGAAEHTARVIGSLSEQYQEILASMRFKELLDVCQKAEKENAGVFDEVQSAILREAAEEQERLSCIRGKKGVRTSGVHSAGGIPCVCRTYGACDGNLDACAREK